MIRPLKKHIPTLILFLILIPLFYVNIRDSHDWGGDFAQYLAQAKNISSGVSHDNTNYIFNEELPVIGPRAYPPGFPLLLSPVYLFFGDKISVFLIYITIFLILFAIAGFYFFRKYFDNLNSILLSLIIAFNPYFLNFKGEIVSDIPFAFFFLFGLLVYTGKNKITPTNAIITGVLAAFLSQVRSVGFTFIIAILIWFVINYIRSKYKSGHGINPYLKHHLLMFLCFIVFFIFFRYILFPLSNSGSYSYAGMFSFSGLIEELLLNIDYYQDRLLIFFQPEAGIWNFLPTLISSFILIFFIIGLIIRIIRQISFSEILFFVYLLVILVYPYRHGGFRLIIPITPLILFYAFYAFTRSEYNKKYKWLSLASIILLLILASYIRADKLIFRYQQNIIEGPQKSESKEVFKYIISDTEKNSVIAFFKPRVLGFYTERQSVAIGNIISVGELLSSIEKYGIDYLLIHKKYSIIPDSLANNPKYPGILKFENRDFKLFGLTRK